SRQLSRPRRRDGRPRAGARAGALTPKAFGDHAPTWPTLSQSGQLCVVSRGPKNPVRSREIDFGEGDDVMSGTADTGRFTLTAVTLVAAALSLPAAPALAQVATTEKVVVEYVAPLNPAHRPILDRLQKRRVLEDLRDFLSPLKLPAPLTIKM